MKKENAIVWFRQDLRIQDHPALFEAAKNFNVIPLYIFDQTTPEEDKIGAACLVWLHHSLKSLNESLSSSLILKKGKAKEILPSFAQKYGVKKVFWSRCYEPWRVQEGTEIKTVLKMKGIEGISFNGSLLWEPWEVHTSEGTPYKVFSQFYNKGCLRRPPPREPLSNLKNLSLVKVEGGEQLEDLDLLPKAPWDKGLTQHWDISEKGAHRALGIFIQTGLKNYKNGRDFPAENVVSRLSPFLHFGLISPNQVWDALKKQVQDVNTTHFCSELGWREFSYGISYHFPTIRRENLQKKFDHFPWKEDREKLIAWQKGKTGIPMVDAAMRELWQTGYMHNRSRMIVGSFLVKNLRIHWHEGEKWFWDCLLDADFANNSASWQWVAGTGFDAAPYFRIFNPVTQGQKFDPEGKYVKKYIPELACLSMEYLFNPWQAPEIELRSAGVILGKDYPFPIVDLKQTRQEALDAFASIRQKRTP